MGSRLFYLYILSLPLSYAFSYYGGRLTMTMLISFCMFLVLFFKMISKKVTIKRNIANYIFPSLCFFLYIVINFILSNSLILTSFLHSLSYIATIAFFFIVPLLFGDYYKTQINNRTIFLSIFIMVLYSSAYTTIQFIANNWFSINLDLLIPWPTEEISNTLFLGYLYRAKGFCAEPGHYAFFLEGFTPLVFYYLFVSGYSQLRMGFKILSFSLIILSLLLTVSAAAFTIIPIAILISLLLNMRIALGKSIKIIKGVLLITVLTSIVVYILSDLLPIFDIVFTSTLDKFDVASGSAEDRISRLLLFNKIFSDATVFKLIIGHGTSVATILGLGENTIVLLYPLLLTELGIIGISIFMFIFYQFFNERKNLDINFIFFYTLSIISLFIHYVFISNYWYPYIWFIGALPFIIQKNTIKG